MIGSRLPKSDPAHSHLLDIGFNRQSFPWKDKMPHLHTESEEYFVVLNGRLDMFVNGKATYVHRQNLIGIRADVPHQIIGGIAPIESFLIRVPGNLTDKMTADSFEAFQEQTRASGDRAIWIDLTVPHEDYLLGACLPATHPNYSPFLDFTCGWDVDPNVGWRNEKLHYHKHREEYYFVLRGQLDFQIDRSQLTLSTGQILGVRPGIAHRVLGGNGPVNVLFVRVPGGRDDKTIVSPY